MPCGRSTENRSFRTRCQPEASPRRSKAIPGMSASSRVSGATARGALWLGLKDATNTGATSTQVFDNIERHILSITHTMGKTAAFRTQVCCIKPSVSTS